MNNQRRKEITKLQVAVAELHETATALYDEEEEYYENMPESIQAGEKGEASERAKEALEEAVTGLDDIGGALDTAME